MPRNKWIDKKNATTFALVHRAQNDPRIHDSDAPDMVFTEISKPGAEHHGKDRGSLEDELGLDPDSIRANEGEAANYGIYYDDSNYDYMQHMRDLGTSSDAYFVEAPQPASKQKNKPKMKLEDMLRETNLDDAADDAKTDASGKPSLPDELLPSKNMRHTSYQEQQDIPDALAGFQPDMDPRLREVLEALEDDAYIDEGEDKDIFGELAKGGEELTEEDFEDLNWGDAPEDEEDEGWETDETAKPDKEFKTAAATKPDHESAEDGDEGHGDDWLHEFREFKKDQKANKAAVAAAPKPKPATPSMADGLSSIVTGTSALTSGRRKKRKGAMTSTSGYSMTSSSIFRTEGQTLLDDRFDKIEEEYNEDGDYDDFPDDDTASVVTGMTGMTGQSSASTQQGPMRGDFDSIMDDFLGGYSMAGKRRVKKGGYQTGIEQLDEVRRGLGPARLKSKQRT
ncbi:Low temperature viability protein [Xylona heveae TC161]|uniref:Low temperature viability protein n=1 Tax=Xylona heveae (strain CBS 132557 / TC161) TaxID=1328760 RepID=A0A164ZJG8_XYLHT|nr:Low temperature viability protein [Xylona heveae TC161]KZF19176.1 Low temperature viability protein [Xylona heveae TC161]